MKTVHQFHLHEPDGGALGAAAGDTVRERELNAWLDGELPVAAHRALELRVATDPALRARVNETNQIRTLVLRACETMLNR